VNGALEFIRQVEQDGHPRPDAIVVPLGSGGTAAGLLLGCWLAGWRVESCAVRVTDPWFANRRRVLRLARRTARLLRRHGLNVVPGPAGLRVVADQLGRGYGHATGAADSARAAFADAGIILDGTYTAKAAAALRSLAASFPHLCFWHTFDIRLLSALPIEHPLLREARNHAESLWPQPKLT
jgi:D-cysteine desulfhydrase